MLVFFLCKDDPHRVIKRVRRVEVYRDYKLHIDFTQFSLGLDIVEIAARNKKPVSFQKRVSCFTL